MKKKLRRSSRKPAARKRAQSQHILVPIFSIVIGVFLFLGIMKLISFASEAGELLGVSTFLAQVPSPTDSLPPVPTNELNNSATEGNTVRINPLTGQMTMGPNGFSGQQTEPPEPIRQQIIQKLNDENIQFGTSDAGLTMIKTGLIQTQTELPVGVNLQHRTMSITIPSGQERTGIMPDTAMSKLIAHQVIDMVATRSAVLTIQSGEPVLMFRGAKSKRLFGVLPVNIEKKVTVDAGSGAVLQQNESVFNRIIDTLSL